MDNKIKHLEFIQAIVTRMNTNSFMLKGWAVTLVAALFALSASGTNHGYFIIAYIPVLVFWGLDGYFLSQERQYRALYDEVRKSKDADLNFSLDASSFATGKRTWASACFSKTIVWFYVPMILIMLLVMYYLK